MLRDTRVCLLWKLNVQLLSTNSLCSWYLLDAGSFGAGLEKSLTWVRNFSLNAFNKDPEINTYVLIAVLVDLGPERRALSLLCSIFSFLLSLGLMK